MHSEASAAVFTFFFMAIAAPRVYAHTAFSKADGLYAQHDAAHVYALGLEQLVRLFK